MLGQVKPHVQTLWIILKSGTKKLLEKKTLKKRRKKARGYSSADIYGFISSGKLEQITESVVHRTKCW